MGKYAKEVVKQAQAWLGKNESDGSHKEIIDVYNSHKPLARGYAVKYTDEWCSTFVSAVAIKLGYTDIIPTECGCEKHTQLFKKIDEWVEDENRIPNVGDIIFYDWQDNGVGDNKGSADHVGIVEKVLGTTITIIEGNYKNAVTRRVINANSRYIRGYGVPKYDMQQGDIDRNTIKELQLALNKTFKSELVIDGIIGKNTTKVLNKVALMNYCSNELVKFVQRRLIIKGYDVGKDGADGKFGKNTEKAVRKFQQSRKLSVDGIVGIKTIMALI